MIISQRSPGREAETIVKGLFADDKALDRADDWTRGVLEKDAIDPASQGLQAVRALRRADKRLSLPAAKLLLDRANGTARSPGKQRRNPYAR